MKAPIVIVRSKHDRRNISNEPAMKELKQMIRHGELNNDRTVNHLRRENMEAQDKQTKDKQVTLRLPEDLHRKLKVKVAQEGTTITEILLRLVKKYVESEE